MADWSRVEGYWLTTPMPDEDIGHICTYTKDKGDRNFKYCIYCKRVKYRTNAEITGDYGTELERKLRGV